MLENNFWGPKSLLTFIVQVMSLFLKELRGWGNTNLWKKGRISQIKKDFGLFCIIEFEKAQKTACKVQKVFWQLLWKLKEPFSNT